MVRPRRFVNEKGTVVGYNSGVSHHAETRRFYCLCPRTSRHVYANSWGDSHDAYVARIADDIPPVERAKMAATADVRRTEAYERVAADPARVAAMESVLIEGRMIAGGSYA